jgi:hypothetical protein
MNQEFELVEISPEADWSLPAKRRLRYWMSNYDAEMKAIDKGAVAVRRFWNSKNLRKRPKQLIYNSYYPGTDKEVM